MQSWSQEEKPGCWYLAATAEAAARPSAQIFISLKRGCSLAPTFWLPKLILKRLAHVRGSKVRRAASFEALE